MPPRSGQMSDAQRRAMWAKMRGRGGASRSSGGASGSWSDEPSAGDTARKIAGAAWERFKGQPEYIDGVPVMAAAMPTLGRLGKSAALSMATGTTASEISDYRDSNPTLNPYVDKALAQVQQLLGYISAGSGLLSLKRGLGATAGKTAPIKSGLKAIKSAGDYAADAMKAAGDKVTPKSVQIVLSKAWDSYKRLADATGLSINDISSKTKAKAAIATLGYLGVTGKEEYDIAKAQDRVAAAWDEGKAFTPTIDEARGTLGTLGAMAVGTTGNFVEKQFRSNIDAGRETTAAYREGYQRIKDAKLPADQEAKALADWADKNKPWNMAGRGVYSLAPASASFLTWKAREVADWWNTPRSYSRIEDDPKVDAERDADTHQIEGTSQRIRYLGGDSTEISHHGQGKDEPYGREAADFAKKLAASGKTVRLVGGGTRKELEANAAAMNRPLSPQGFEQDKGWPDKKTGKIEYRAMAYPEVLKGPELLTRAVSKVPVVRDLWPATDMLKETIAAGLADPRYEEMGSVHSRRKDYHEAALTAIDKQLGRHSPEGIKAMQDAGLYQWKPAPGERLPTAEDRLMTAAGIGLMTSGNAGIIKSMGKLGDAIAPTWNAGLAVGGARQYNRAAELAAEKKQRKIAAPKVVAKEPKIERKSLLKSDFSKVRLE